jgi:hypothetical protein
MPGTSLQDCSRFGVSATNCGFCTAGPTILATIARMHSRFFASVLVALALAGSYQVSTAARSAPYLVCELEDHTDIFIVIDDFGGMGGAMKQCVHYWHGHPRGVTN